MEQKVRKQTHLTGSIKTELVRSGGVKGQPKLYVFCYPGLGITFDMLGPA